MNAPPSSPAPVDANDSLHDARAGVRREQWLLLLGSVRGASLPTLLIGALFALFYAQYVPAAPLLTWWLALAAVLGLRHWVARPADAGVALRRGPTWLLHALLFATGLLWGLAPAAVLPGIDDTLLVTVVLLGAGMALAAFSAYSVSLAAVTAQALPLALANLAVLTLTRDPAHYALAAALALLYVHQGVVMVQARGVLERQIRLRVENALLAQQLSQQAEKTAAELERRMEVERSLRASRDRAERLSGIDALTDIANRRYFDNRLKQEVSRAFRERAPLSLVLCDIDFFKQYNDTYGHQRGDECLKLFARTLVSYCRRGGDLPARVGGEEFAVLLPHTEHAAALKLADLARAAFDALEVEHLGSKLKPNVTASFGVATSIPTHLDAGEALVRAADQALYLAKSRGRNQVASAVEVESLAN